MHGLSRSLTFAGLLLILPLALAAACSGGGGGGDDDDVATSPTPDPITIPNADTAFGGGDGYTLGGDEGYAYSFAFQADGKILVCGTAPSATSDFDMMVLRLNTDGTVDTTFGTGGRTLVPASTFDDYGFGIATLSDGRIIVVGAAGLQFLAGGDIVAALLLADGTLDVTFSGDGIYVIDTPNAAGAKAVAVDSTDRIVLVGTIQNTDEDMVVARMSDTGVLDATFNGTGSIIDNQGSYERGEAVAISGGKIIVAGGYTARIYRFNDDGTPDNTFSGNGNVPTGDPLDVLNAMAVQADGKILFAGFDDETIDPILASVARFDAAGVLDPTFGSGGYLVLHSGVAEAIVQQPDGRIVVGGQHIFTPTIVRLSATGIRDATWGSSGTLYFDEVSFGAAEHELRLDSTGRYVVAGTHVVDGQHPIVFRVLP